MFPWSFFKRATVVQTITAMHPFFAADLIFAAQYPRDSPPRCFNSTFHFRRSALEVCLSFSASDASNAPLFSSHPFAFPLFSSYNRGRRQFSPLFFLDTILRRPDTPSRLVWILFSLRTNRASPDTGLAPPPLLATCCQIPYSSRSPFVPPSFPYGFGKTHYFSSLRTTLFSSVSKQF